MRLIDADKVIEKMTARIKEIPYGKDTKECNYARLDEEAYARTLVQNAPTIDAVPVKHGHIVTEETIAAVYSYFAAHMPKILKYDDSAEFSVTYTTSEYELVMRRKSKETNDDEC